MKTKIELRATNVARQLYLWPEDECLRPTVVSVAKQNLKGLSRLQRWKMRYLNKHYLPKNCEVEGVFEFPKNAPYNGTMPDDLVDIEAKIPTGFQPHLALNGFGYDYINERIWNNIDWLITRAKHYGCVLAPDFSPLVDGRRCEVIEAVRRNRFLTVALQHSGIPTIQTASWGNVDSFSFVFDGLAENCPTAIEHICTPGDGAKRELFRLGVEELVKRKHPNPLIVYGYLLDFDPSVPVVYYKCRIQKLRTLRYNRLRKIA